MLELHFTAQKISDTLFMQFWVHLAILLTTCLRVGFRLKTNVLLTFI